YYDMGVASHYFFDSRNFFHRVQKEDYENCHKPFETRVGDRIGKGAFTVTQCNVTVTDRDFVPWLAEFRALVDGSVFGKQSATNNSVPSGAGTADGGAPDPAWKRELPQLASFAIFMLAGLILLRKKLLRRR
ncbi:hypothetical protein HYS54_04005, partial [Candidatus Micrarchaeota archaeon]|nr:hypothetical protein [Candidatus Micrarchaeota archaeon]